MSAAGDIWTTTVWPSGWNVRHVAETSSTNTDLLDAVASGAAGERSVLVADHQLAGRGRLDRRWDAPAGTNLLVSIVLAPTDEVPSESTHRVGLAALRASRRFVGDGASLGLKWPNDLLLNDRKLAGILAQRSPTDEAVVVGLGLNVRWAPDGAAALVDAVAQEPAGDSGPHPAAVLREVLLGLDGLAALDSSGLREVYRSELDTLGREVRVELPDGSVLTGRAVDVDEHGRLVVDSADERRVLDVGDVVHVRPR